MCVRVTNSLALQFIWNNERNKNICINILNLFRIFCIQNCIIQTRCIILPNVYVYSIFNSLNIKSILYWAE